MIFNGTSGPQVHLPPETGIAESALASIWVKLTHYRVAERLVVLAEAMLDSYVALVIFLLFRLFGLLLAKSKKRKRSTEHLSKYSGRFEGGISRQGCRSFCLAGRGKGVFKREPKINPSNTF